MDSILNDEFKKKIEESGKSLEKVEKELHQFEKGFDKVKLQKPALVGDGIVQIKDDEYEKYFSLHQKAVDEGLLMKFVPASGAASRMFKKLEIADNEKLSYNQLYSKKDESEYKAALEFVDNIEKFAFFEDLKNEFKESGKDAEEIIKQKKADEIIHFTINSDGLNYSSLPKGIIKFHKYEDHSRTAFEEQIVEAVDYASQKNQKAVVHFTVPVEFKKEITEFLEEAKKRFENDVKIELQYSVQKPETDTVAVDLENKPFIEDSGKILFRPAGHGALLENLNDLDADIVFIKNIDNVTTERLKEKTVRNKKLLAGYMMDIRENVFEYLRKLDQENIEEAEVKEIETFANGNLNIRPAENYKSKSLEEKKEYLRDKLNRPIRVCGMVLNEGHPGGGPFWIEEKDGEYSLQIIEGPQIDMEDGEQKKILEASTHFNPVDLVCSLKNYRGEKFDLHKYRDPETGFITKKSKSGRELKALELPGLWNGSMAFWNTIFVEVPKETFTPVKEVNDLLKPEHQN